MKKSGFLNDTVAGLKPSGIRKFFDIVSEMPDAISLGVGEPDFVTPWGIRDYAVSSIQRGYTQYTSNRGLIKLREEISEYLSERFSLPVYDPEREILVTVGASESIDLALRAVVSPGDEVLVPDPSYVSYMPNITLAGGVCVPVETRMEDDFKLRPEALEAAITPRTKAMILPYPNNPTGAVMESGQLAKICDVIKRNGLFVISDEIYAELTYGGRHVSIAQLDGMKERTLVINGFSKSFAMTGWRLGFAAGPEEVVEGMYKIHQYTIMCAPTASQYAGWYALHSGRREGYSSVEEMRSTYDKRRRLIVSEFNAMGLTCFEPKGAFYCFPNVKSTGLSGEQFAERLLRAEKVAVVPGDAFGRSGREFIRCSYAASLKAIETALGRIKRFLASV